MIKKIVYIVSLMSLNLLTILTIDMLPFIFKSKYQGILFLFIVLFVLIVELYALIRYKNLLKNNIGYNVLLILNILYVTIVYYKLYYNRIDFLYTTDIVFLRQSYLLISISFMFIITYLYSIIKETKKRK